MLYILQCWWMTQRRKWADADNTNEKKAHGLSLDGLKYRIVKKDIIFMNNAREEKPEAQQG